MREHYPAPGMTEKLRIELSADEMLSGVVVAAQRKITSDTRRRNGHESRRAEHYEERRTWDQEINSALAELAVCRWRNRYWQGSNFQLNGAGTDAGMAQVRWTVHETGHLILYPEDDPDAYYVLVTGEAPSFTVRGWIRGEAGMLALYWRETGGGVKADSWWIPQDALEHE